MDSNEAARNLYPYMVDKGFVKAWEDFIEVSMREKYDFLSAHAYGDLKVFGDIAVINYMKNHLAVLPAKIKDKVKSTVVKEKT